MSITNKISIRMDELEEKFQLVQQSIQEHKKSIDEETIKLLKIQGEFEGLKRLIDLPNDKQLQAKKK